jgi:hypothetical protein
MVASGEPDGATDVVDQRRRPTECRPIAFFSFFTLKLLGGAGEDCFRGLFLLEVSLALVGVASPAYFQY